MVKKPINANYATAPPSTASLGAVTVANRLRRHLSDNNVMKKPFVHIRLAWPSPGLPPLRRGRREKRDIYCINVLTNNILKFSSLTDCGKALSINRSTIKNYLISGQIYKNYRFTFKA